MRRCCGAPSSPAKLEWERSAVTFAQAGMHSEAAHALLERAKLSPDNPMIWNDLGVEYMAAGNPDEAHRAFVRAVKVLPDYSVALYNLARLTMGRCVEKQAMRALSPVLILSLAIEAIGYLNASMAKDSLLHEAHTLLYYAYSTSGDTARAASHRQAALRLNPDVFAKPQRTWRERLLLVTKGPSRSPILSVPFIASSLKRMNIAL